MNSIEISLSTVNKINYSVNCPLYALKYKSMFRDTLNNIEGVSVFPIFSLLVFFVFFTALGYWVFKADKKYVKHMENLPFDNEK